jgi:hypothetical protein
MIVSAQEVTGIAVVMLSLGVLLVVGGLTPVVVGSPLAQQPAPAPSACTAAPAATPMPLSLQTLTQIQLGLSTYTMEAAQRFEIVWFAAKNQNWDLAAFEAREAKGVLQHAQDHALWSNEQCVGRTRALVSRFRCGERHVAQMRAQSVWRSRLTCVKLSHVKSGDV